MKRAADIDAAAANWILKRDRADWSASDEQELARWVKEDRAHHIAMLRLSSIWSKADRLRATALNGGEVAAVSQGEVVPELPEGRRRPQRWLWPAALAASLALLAAPIYQRLMPSQAYTTAIGGFQHIPLADGSNIDLNTNSRLEVDYSANDRRIALEQGEAYFTVAKNKDRPFQVEAGDWRVTAVGTAFTVHAKEGALDVIVTEGRVRIDGLRGSAQVAPIYASAGQAVRVETLAKRAPVVEALGAEAVEQALGWRDGLLTFEARPLAEVAAELNRYNHIQMSVDESAADVRVDGSFRTTNAAGFIRLVEEGFDVEAVRSGDRIIFIKKK